MKRRNYRLAIELLLEAEHVSSGTYIFLPSRFSAYHSWQLAGLLAVIESAR